jgi:4-hydroxythreonine-4-phosphate dehydrogenase
MAAPPIALTLGEPAGIGPELAVAAWQRLGARLPFFVVGDPEHLDHLGVPVGPSPPRPRRPMPTLSGLPVLPIPSPPPPCPADPTRPMRRPSSPSSPAPSTW